MHPFTARTSNGSASSQPSRLSLTASPVRCPSTNAATSAFGCCSRARLMSAFAASGSVSRKLTAALANRRCFSRAALSFSSFSNASSSRRAVLVAISRVLSPNPTGKSMPFMSTVSSHMTVASAIVSLWTSRQYKTHSPRGSGNSWPRISLGRHTTPSFSTDTRHSNPIWCCTRSSSTIVLTVSESGSWYSVLYSLQRHCGAGCSASLVVFTKMVKRLSSSS